MVWAMLAPAEVVVVMGITVAFMDELVWISTEKTRRERHRWHVEPYSLILCNPPRDPGALNRCLGVVASRGSCRRSIAIGYLYKLVHDGED